MLPAPAPPPFPAVSVRVTDGQDSVRPGARPRYTVTVRNDGGAALGGLRLEQRIPFPATGPTADQGGTVDGAVVSWTVALPAHGEKEFHVRVRVGRGGSSDAEQDRLATTACAFLGVAAAPMACAADVDALAAARPAVPGGEGTGTTAAGIAAALAAAVGAALLVLRQRSRRFRPNAATSAESEDQAA